MRRSRIPAAEINARDEARAREIVAARNAAATPFDGAPSSFLNRAADQYPVPFNTVPFDLTTWTNQDTMPITAGQADPLGGTNAYLLDDNSGIIIKRLTRQVIFPSAGPKRFSIFAKAGSSPWSHIWPIRVSDSFSWGAALIAWDALGVPAATFVSSAGNGRVATSFSGVPGWYKFDVYYHNIDASAVSMRFGPNHYNAETLGTATFFRPTFWSE